MQVCLRIITLVLLIGCWDAEATSFKNISVSLIHRTITHPETRPTVPTTPPSDACSCGKRNHSNDTSRVVGGTDTSVNEYPWQAALLGKQGHFFCGGSIINRYYILTAAHCVAALETSYPGILIGLGDHNTTDMKLSPHTFVVKTVTVHPGYDKETIDNDIAVLKLSSPIQFDNQNKIAPVCLPANADDKYAHVNATVTGWGTTIEGGKLSIFLQEVTVPTMSNEECQELYSRRHITSNMICAGLAEGGKDACQGDSGGPFVTEQGTCMVQIGIVSWGNGCARPGSPGVYTRVTKYLDWIDEHTEGGVSCTHPLN